MILHVNWSRAVVLATAEDCKPDHFCFLRRKRLPHSWEFIGDPPEVCSYYEPLPALRCSGCGEDHTLGFGWGYDGPHYPEAELQWIDTPAMSGGDS